MRLRLWWCVLLLFANAAWSVTNGLIALPTSATDGKNYAAHFAIGLSVDGGKSWQSSANLNQQVILKGSLEPDPAHVGKNADVFVVQLLNGKFTMLLANGTWAPWSGKVADLQPAQEQVLLAASQEIVIFTGTIGVTGQQRLYMGYQPANSSALIYSAAPAIFEFNAAVDPLNYFQTQIFDSIVMQQCTLCHVTGGVADKSGLHFIRDANLSRENYDIFSKFYASTPNAYNYVLSKVSGGSGHLGGERLPVGSSDYQKFSAFLDLLDGSKAGPVSSTQSLFDGVVLQNRSDTLRNVALLLAGRLPTTEESAAVVATDSSDDKLQQVLLGLMSGPHFHSFLKNAANDRLLLRGNEDTNLAKD